jgi:hypothetical protein
MHFCTRCGNPRDAGATLCAWCGTRFNDPDADHPVRGAVADDATRVDLGEPYQEPQPTIWDYGVPRTPESGPWAASPTMQDYEAPLLPGFDFGEQAAPPHGYYTEPQQVQADPWAVPPGQPQAGVLPPDGPRPGGHRRPSQGRPRGTLVAAGVLLLLALGGGAYALTSALTGHPGRPSAQGRPVTAPTTPAARTSPLPAATPPVATQVRTPRPAGPTTAPATAVPPTTTPVTTTPVTTAPAQVTPGTEPPDTESPSSSPSPSTGTPPPPAPGTTTVATTAAARASGAEPGVAEFLSDYFTAINHHDYQAYIALLDPAQAAKETPARFAAGYGTTTDSDATLTSIADLGSGRGAASVTFTSHQASSASPDHSSCDVWHITLYLNPNGGSYLIRRPPSGYQAHVRSCS